MSVCTRRKSDADTEEVMVVAERRGKIAHTTASGTRRKRQQALRNYAGRRDP